MSDLIKENWFIVVIAILILCSVVYFIQDTTKDNISAKQHDGKDVVATLKDETITADDLYEESTPFDAPLLYNMYKNGVISESVSTTDDLKDEAKSMQNTIDSNLKAQGGENYQIAIDAELATYGFNGYEELYDYCLVNVKQKVMNKEYITEHFDEYKKPVMDLNPRTISFIKVDAANGEETKKMESIDKALKKDSFAKTASAFSEDVMTSQEKGFFGYVDSTDTMQSTGLDTAVLESAMSLKKSETSDWIQVADANTGLTSFFKVHVDETDLSEIFKSKNKMVQDRTIGAFLQANPNLEMTVIENAAKKLDIKFKDKEAKKKIDAYMDLMQEEGK